MRVKIKFKVEKSKPFTILLDDEHRWRIQRDAVNLAVARQHSAPPLATPASQARDGGGVSLVGGRVNYKNR